MILRKSFYIRWSAGRSPRVHEVNPGRDPSKSHTNTVPCVGNNPPTITINDDSVCRQPIHAKNDIKIRYVHHPKVHSEQNP